MQLLNIHSLWPPKVDILCYIQSLLNLREKVLLVRIIDSQNRCQERKDKARKRSRNFKFKHKNGGGGRRKQTHPRNPTSGLVCTIDNPSVGQWAFITRTVGKEDVTEGLQSGAAVGCSS